MRKLDHSMHAHRRLNALTGDWVLVSPQRTTRPWQGQVEQPTGDTVPAHDAACYMCPGSVRASGVRNPSYTSTFVFTNDFPALGPGAVSEGQPVDHGGARDGDEPGDSLLTAHAETGVCRVVCFSPRHDVTLSGMTRDEIRRVIDVWVSERQQLAARDEVQYVQIFENRGAIMGASNPHPHGQIWASSSVPVEPAKEQARQRSHLERFGRDLLGDYLDRELAAGERLVCANGGFVALVPFWAVWPFETLIVPRRGVPSIDRFTGAERDELADMLKRLLTRCDNLFDTPCPYSMGFHEQPADGTAHPEWRWHAHIFPPLLRSASVRKFMVGYELLATPQRDISPEEAAERLRQVAEA